MSRNWWKGPAGVALADLCRRDLPGELAVFDADGTLWQHDLEEALLASMEVEGSVDLARIPKALLPLDPEPGEGPTAYYQRLCDWRLDVGYAWIAQAFAGHPIEALKARVAGLFDGSPDDVFRVPQWRRGKLTVRPVRRPSVLPQQADLVKSLGVAEAEVVVVTAALRILVEGALEHLAKTSGELADISKVVGLELVEHQGVLLPYVVPPCTWYQGKVVAIRAHWPGHVPVLVAGDSPSDAPMMALATARPDGVGLWIKDGKASLAG